MRKGLLFPLPIIAVWVVLLLASPLHAGGTILVKWKDGLDSPAAAEGNRQLGGRVKRKLNALGWQVIELPDGRSASDAAKDYQALGTVVAAHPDHRVEVILPPVDVSKPDDHVSHLPGMDALRLRSAAPSPGVVPNDPMFRQQWGLRRIAATNAWAVTTGSRDVVVAIIDAGVNYNHQDLRVI